MVFKRKDHLVGLDIGSQSIKVAEIKSSKNARTLKKFGMTELPPGLIEEGAINDPQAVADAIRQLFKTYNIREKKVALSIGGYSIIIKKINLQKISEEQLLETIHFEAEQYIPFDVNDVNLDFQVLGESEHNPDQMNVLLVAAKKELISDYINLVQMAGLEPAIIDVDAFALQNVYESSYVHLMADETDESDVPATALIDIGASKTSLNILKGFTSLFMRDISFGCNLINQKIAFQCDCSIEEAERIKRDDSSGRLSAENLAAIISDVSEEWIDEIRRALDFYYSSFPDDRIGRIILSGGGSKMNAIRERLIAETGADVETIKPFGNLNIDDEGFDASYLEQIAPQAAIAMGLALRRVDDK
ncbi:MAG: type IV pilus assembly protein PilM [Desulfobacterales bacterium]|jgi:type IV pilus assembly protein PilM|nr:type IV pilus assembly protein PilM [Desulfobacterales bacterium]